jgi:hypothetical protein
MIMKMSRNEQKEDKDSINILANEIKSWKDFECALREESALLFDKMLSECRQNKDYIRAVSSKGEGYSSESLFMLLVLQQQKMINELIAKVSEWHQQWTVWGGHSSAL